MRKILVTLAAATALTSAPAVAQEVTVEARINGIQSDQTDGQQFKIGVKDRFGLFNIGGEIRVKQAEDEGDVGAKATLSVGPALPTILGFKPSVDALVGRSFQEGNNFDFWGAKVGLGRDLFGPLSAKVSYRHLEGFGADYNQERVSGGLGWALSDRNKVSVTYYHYFDGHDKDSIGVGFTRKF